MGVTKSYKFIWFGDMHETKPYEFIWFGRRLFRTHRYGCGGLCPVWRALASAPCCIGVGMGFMGFHSSFVLVRRTPCHFSETLWSYVAAVWLAFVFFHSWFDRWAVLRGSGAASSGHFRPNLGGLGGPGPEL